MADFHVSGGLKRGTAIALVACFLLGSSITSLAAGDGVANAYEGLTETTKTRTDDVENEESDVELSRAYDLDPAKVTMMEDGIEPYSSDWELEMTIYPGETIMTAGFRREKGDKVAVALEGIPDDVEYEFGLKDPDAMMWYVEGVGIDGHVFTIRQDGRHYFYVTNLSETEDLHIKVVIIK